MMKTRFASIVTATLSCAAALSLTANTLAAAQQTHELLATDASGQQLKITCTTASPVLAEGSATTAPVVTIPAGAGDCSATGSFAGFLTTAAGFKDVLQLADLTLNPALPANQPGVLTLNPSAGAVNQVLVAGTVTLSTPVPATAAVAYQTKTNSWPAGAKLLVNSTNPAQPGTLKLAPTSTGAALGATATATHPALAEQVTVANLKLSTTGVIGAVAAAEQPAQAKNFVLFNNTIAAFSPTSVIGAACAPEAAAATPTACAATANQVTVAQNAISALPATEQALVLGGASGAETSNVVAVQNSFNVPAAAAGQILVGGQQASKYSFSNNQWLLPEALVSNPANTWLQLVDQLTVDGVAAGPAELIVAGGQTTAVKVTDRIIRTYPARQAGVLVKPAADALPEVPAAAKAASLNPLVPQSAQLMAAQNVAATQLLLTASGITVANSAGTPAAVIYRADGTTTTVAATSAGKIPLAQPLAVGDVAVVYPALAGKTPVGAALGTVVGGVTPVAPEQPVTPVLSPATTTLQPAPQEQEEGEPWWSTLLSIFMLLAMIGIIGSQVAKELLPPPFGAATPQL